MAPEGSALAEDESPKLAVDAGSLRGRDGCPSVRRETFTRRALTLFRSSGSRTRRVRFEIVDVPNNARLCRLRCGTPEQARPGAGDRLRLRLLSLSALRDGAPPNDRGEVETPTAALSRAGPAPGCSCRYGSGPAPRQRRVGRVEVSRRGTSGPPTPRPSSTDGPCQEPGEDDTRDRAAIPIIARDTSCGSYLVAPEVPRVCT